MVPTHLRRSLLVVLLAALIAALPAATALAANPGTTSTFHHQVDIFVLPCTDIPRRPTASSTSRSGRCRTAPGTFTGTFTVWDGGMAFNPVISDEGEILSADKWVDTMTFMVRGTGSDGSSIFQHATGYINACGAVGRRLTARLARGRRAADGQQSPFGGTRTGAGES